MELDIDKLKRSIKACAHHPEHDCRKCEYSNDKLWCYNDKLLSDFDKTIDMLKEQEERIKLLEHQLETLTKWRMNSGAFD